MTSTLKTLILASGSPWRRQLLAATGAAFEVHTAGVDEEAITADHPRILATLRAEAKALAVAARSPQSLVIGADQVLSLDGVAFDKVATEEEARARLRMLAGRTHHLHSALVLAMGPRDGQDARVLSVQVVDVAMPMRPLSSEDIEAYLATQEWQGSVGCYQYENRGIHLFDGVAQDQSAIVGLPLQELFKALRSLGVDLLRHPHPPWRL